MNLENKSKSEEKDDDKGGVDALITRILGVGQVKDDKDREIHSDEENEGFRAAIDPDTVIGVHALQKYFRMILMLSGFSVQYQITIQIHTPHKKRWRISCKYLIRHKYS